MSSKSRGKIFLTLLLILTLAWSGLGVQASTAAAASSTPFSDVAAGHWAEKHIAKLALQGLVQGANGKFTPNGVLTRQDAVIIAIRFMGWEDKAKASGTAAFPSTFLVSDYAKSYVNYAIKQKLITNEQFALAESEKNVEWGKAPATREWITRLLVRCIGLESDATAAAGKATAFADNAAIDTSLLGYVNVAVAQGLVKGLDGNKFTPKTSVTRATVATLFSRAESMVLTSFPGQVNGMLLSAAADKISLLQADGTVTSYAITGSTLFSRMDSEALTSLNSLKVNGTATVIAGSNGQAAYVEQLDDTAKVKTVTGKLVVVNTSKHTLLLLNGEDTASYEYDANYLPVVTDAENNVLTLADLPSNGALTLTLDTYRTAGKVISVKVNQSVVSKTGQGSVLAINSSLRTLQIKDSTTSVADTRTVSDSAVIRTADGNNASLNDLKVGDTVNYEVKDGLLTKVTVTQSASVNTVAGVLFKVDTAAQTIQYTSTATSTDIRAKLYTTGVTVKINGVTNPTIADLVTGDAVILTLNADGKVTGVEVSGRSVQYLNGAIISSYDSDAKVLVVKDASNNIKTYTLGANVRYDQNGTSITAATAALYMYKGKKVDIGYSNGNVVYLSFIAQYTGTITENNTTAKYLKITLENGNSVSVNYVNPVVQIYGKTAQNFTQVAVGDKVTVLLDAYQTTIDTIKVYRTIQFEVTSVDTLNSKLRVKQSDGTVDEWTIGTGISLLDENGASAALASFSVGSVVNVNVQGVTPVTIRKVNVLVGRIASIDTGTGNLSIQSGSSAAVTLTVGTAPIVIKNGITSNTLSTVAVNDRVEVRKDEQDRTVITVITPIQKSLWYTDASSNTLYYKKEVLTDANNYVVLSSQTYLHQGDTVLTLAGLNVDDVLTIYVLRGKAIEILK